MSEYTPELGQSIFGQAHKQYDVPVIWDAALSFLREELSCIMRNIHQTDYSNPFGNTGNEFSCPVFKIEAYSWDDAYEQPFNFKWEDVEISWYKYLGRGMSANKELSPDLAATMLAECLEACRQIDGNP